MPDLPLIVLTVMAIDHAHATYTSEELMRAAKTFKYVLRARDWRRP
ncbi:hypothetical protein [Nonomuraea sp. NPDC049695]